MSDRAVLLGVPWDGGASGPRGAAGGPGAVRRRLFSDAGNGHAASLADVLGADVLLDVGDCDPPADEAGARRVIERAARDAAAQGAPLVLGGDHSVSLPLLRAAAGRWGALQVLHFDAHPDLYPELDGRRYSHASPFARALEEGVIDRILQIGIRANTPPQAAFARSFGDRVRQYGPGELDRIDPVFLAAAPRYVSIDVDALDPAFAPGVAHPESGGLTPRELLQLLAAHGSGWVAADLVELVPERDVADLTAIAAAKLVKELLAVRA